jgi:CRISPR-associated protein Cas2
MAFRNLIIESPASLSVRSGQLVIRTDAVEKHRARLKQNLPDNGAVRMLVIMEKQYEAIDILLGKLTEADDPFQAQQLTTF